MDVPPESPPSEWVLASPLPEEEEDRPHNYDQDKYKKVSDLIDSTEGAPSFYDLARRVVREALRSQEPLNLMNDSVLHLLIYREKTDLAVTIIDALKPIEGGMLLHHKNYYGDTPLHIAATKGDVRVAKALLKKSKTLAEKRNRKRETPLHKAAQFGKLEVFHTVIEVGGSQLASGLADDGSNVLHYAIMHGQTKVALAIAKRFPELISSRNAHGASPLQIMAAYLRKPPKSSGMFKSPICEDAPLEEYAKRDEESDVIDEFRPPKRGNWWSRLPAIISHLRRIMAKATERVPDDEMNRELLKVLVANDFLSFYIKGFTRGGAANLPDRDTISSISSDTVDRPTRQVMPEKEKEKAKSSHESADAKDRIKWEESPLITGVKLGSDDFVIQVLRVSPESATSVDYGGMNVLQAAVKYGRWKVVKAIKEDRQLPSWLFTELESGTNNTLLHIAASNKIFKKQGDPLRLQDELEWFEWLEKIVPPELKSYRNTGGKTAQEVFDYEHEEMLKGCSEKLAAISQACSPLLAAVVFTSSFFIPGDDNLAESNRLVFDIFSHAYVVGFSCAATSLILFLLLMTASFGQRDFRHKVPLHYMMACFLLTISLAAFFVAFGCNVYLQIYAQRRKPTAGVAKILLELLVVPSLCFFMIPYLGTSAASAAFKRVAMSLYVRSH